MKTPLFSLLFILFAGTVFSQAPQAFKFQTIIRNTSGEVLPLQDLTLKFLIHNDTPEGEVVYSEQHFVTTNPSGLVSVNVGLGDPISGSFADIVWGEGEYFLEEQIDVGNTGEFQIFGTVQLLSVPYALHANTAGNGIQSMSTEERDSLENPAVGMQIYNTTTNCLNYWNGTNWFETCGECTPMPSQAVAGSDQLGLEGSWTTLAANQPDIGEGFWSILQGEGGQVTTSNDPASIFLGQFNQHYILEWSISSVCDIARDEVNIAFGFVPFLNCGDTLVDTRDMQKYATVQIGDQCWMEENLAYLPSVSPSSEGSTTEPYYYVYNYQGTVVAEAKAIDNFYNYGVLYNWPSSFTVCPNGWHLSSDTEWIMLTDYLGGTGVAGGKMKSTRKDPDPHPRWNSPNTGATNSSGFSGLPGGYRWIDGLFGDNGSEGIWWSPNEDFPTFTCVRGMKNDYGDIFSVYTLNEQNGFSVRCLRGEASVNYPPYPPSSPNPANGSKNQPLLNDIAWTCTDPEGAPLTYDIYFGTETTTPLVAAAITDTFYTPGTLEYATIYYWKIIAYDDQGNSTEGVVWSFTTIDEPWECGDLLIDERDGQEYGTVQIDDQCWMEENLTYLPEVSPSSDGNNTDPYYYVYDYQGTDVATAKATENYQNYGVLYNWPASLNACPTNWHLPTDADWTVLTTYLGGESVAGGKMKETGTAHWYTPNTGATNSSGFSGLPGGYRYPDAFVSIEYGGFWWSSTESSATDSWFLYLGYYSALANHDGYGKSYGFSVRCLRD